MLFNADYSGQIFCDREGGMISFSELSGMSYGNTVSKPRPVSQAADTEPKIFKTGLLITLGLAIAAGGIAFLVSRSGIGSFALGFMCLFLGGTTTVFSFICYKLLIRTRRITEPVEAKCIGYSLHSEKTDTGGGTTRCPVFEYSYGGKDYVAFDGMYTGSKKIPGIGSVMDIWIDPNDPAELLWSKSNIRKTFVFDATICAALIIAEIVLIVSMLFDEGLFP
ncbi:MAG: hypothetical protein J5379_00990 [Clostridiales bacterium]|nr:hypothetical protein [Clostridiales bacterium]